VVQFHDRLKQPEIHLATALSDGRRTWGVAIYTDRSGAFKIILQVKKEGKLKKRGRGGRGRIHLLCVGEGSVRAGSERWQVASASRGLG